MAQAITMTLPTESNQRTKALLITALFAIGFAVLMFLLKWKLPTFETPVEYAEIEVELNLPPDPPVTEQDGGGGGGNPVQATGEAGVAPAAPMPSGTTDPSQDVEEDNNSPSPAITKPVTPTRTKAAPIQNTSNTKTEPKVVNNPAPPPARPKAVMGKTTTGTGKGGGAAENYDRSGGTGTGAGVGNGSGVGGGNGTGIGGGNGSGTGSGTGPRVVKGDRRIIRAYSFEGNLDKAIIYANITVSPDGKGSFHSIAKGSTQTSTAYKNEIIRYLPNVSFDKSDHESIVTVRFDFKVN